MAVATFFIGAFVGVVVSLFISTRILAELTKENAAFKAAAHKVADKL